MYFSRRKLTVPSPPRPASTRISASSTNFTTARACRMRTRNGRGRYGLPRPGDEKAPTRGAFRRRDRGGAQSATTLTCNRFRSEEHTSELQSRENLVCRLLLEKKKKQRRDR